MPYVGDVDVSLTETSGNKEEFQLTAKFKPLGHHEYTMFDGYYKFPSCKPINFKCTESELNVHCNSSEGFAIDFGFNVCADPFSTNVSVTTDRISNIKVADKSRWDNNFCLA